MKIVILGDETKLSPILGKAKEVGFNVLSPGEIYSEKIGTASLVDEFSGKEYFNTSQDNPIKFQGDRFDTFEYGVTLPVFDSSIINLDKRVQAFFEQSFVIIKNFNSRNSKKIFTILYKADQIHLSSDEFVKYFDSFILAYKSQFSEDNQG